MVNRIQDILDIKETQKFLDTFKAFSIQLEAAIAPLLDLLALNLSTGDVSSTVRHMSTVESWRVKVTRYHGFAAAFSEHARSSQFLIPKSKDITEKDREANMKSLTAGPQALQMMLSNLLGCIDSRVNLCKKLLGMESDSAGVYRKVA